MSVLFSGDRDVPDERYDRPNDFDSFAQEALLNAVYPDRGRNVTYTALGLAGETGEYCEHVKKAVRDDGDVITPERREAMLSELGDVLWYVAANAAELGYSLRDVAQANLEKCRRRTNGTIRGSGSAR